MNILQNIRQGDAEWLSVRAQHLCASEAAAALGVSKYTTRAELLRQKATGIVAEVSPQQQRIFDAGHEAERAARVHAERIAGEDLSPVVGTLDVDGLPLLASFDGISFMGDVVWENKLLNKTLAAQIASGELEPHYWLQLEQQLLVSGAERVLFTASDGSEEGTLYLWYSSQPERRARLLYGWRQFQRDVAAWHPTESAAQAVAAPVESLPAVIVQVSGALTVGGNLPAFGEALRTFIARIPAKPANDQEFADAEAACKALKKAEDALESAESQALAQIDDVEIMRRTVADLRTLARSTRLATEKLVAAEKEARKAAIVMEAQRALEAHVAQLNQELAAQGAGQLHQPIMGFFAGHIKGLKSLDSMREKVTAALLEVKADASASAQRLRENRASLRRDDGDWIFLFADFAAVGTKAAEDFQALADLRINKHKQAEAQRLEAERERIRKEEADRADREARAKLEADARAAQEAIAQASQQSQIAQPVAADLSGLVAERHAEGLAQQVIQQAASPSAPPLVASEPPDDGARINLGAINEHLQKLKVDAAQLAALGFEPVATVKASKLYRASDLPAIRAALIEHLESLQEVQAA